MIAAYNALIGSLSFDPHTEQVLLDPKVLQEHHFYLHLVKYLAPVYPAVPEAAQQRLGVAVYLYFRFALSCDRLIDDKKSLDGAGIKGFFVHIRLLEAAVRELSAFFPAGHDFWPQFEKSREQYLSAILAEKQLAKQSVTLTRERFEQLAAGKSALCYAVPVAMGLLPGADSAQLRPLQQCLEYLHIGFQYLDDIDDYQKDIQEGQPNFAACLLAEKLAAMKLQSPLPEGQERYKLLFLTGVATHCLEHAILNFEKSLASIAGTGLAQLEHYISRNIHKAQEQIKAISLLVDKAKVKASHSSQHQHVAKTQFSVADIEQAIANAKAFLWAAMEDDGSWTDFLTNAGLGRNWITAYVAMNLTEVSCDNALPDKAAALLFSEKFSGAYNPQISSDADSLNFLIGFLHNREYQIEPSLLEEWTAFCSSGGGWSTYHNPAILRSIMGLKAEADVSGWLSPKTCVSAAALYVLSRKAQYGEGYQRSADYLADMQKENGSWDSYWWSSPVYATAYAIQALSASGRYGNSCMKAVDWLCASQSSGGCWNSDIIFSESPLYTAMAMKALLHADALQNAPNLTAAQNWLLHHQTSDGSWQSTYALLVPSPEIHDIREVSRWKKGSFGVNTIVDDHSRVFTTVTVVNTLEYLLTKIRQQ
ncbi:hypothetical protein ACDQ55_19800 [Chitinophaga sp. 30R24]|uniref:hypothetical protein n=1 Tax=Chitinophaga sp. 30R24 TaxID=3248838 RepID=UPI003B8EBCC1